MRWLSGRLRADERGAVAVVVALLMVVLIGFVAISVDVGANYVERRQLQNGADAAALAIAQDTACKRTPTGAAAQDLVKANVNDGLARGSAVVSTTKRTVTATASAIDASGAPGRRNWFAPVLGFSHTQVSASATAGCAFPLAGTAELPLTFHKCHFTTPGVKILISYNTTAPRCNGTSGNAAPGNFGWLRGANGGCPALIPPGGWTRGDNGNNIPTPCKPTLEKLRNQVALIPIYDDVTGNGSSGNFHVVGFAAFKVLGYRFSGNPEYNWQNDIHGALSCTGNCRGIIGTFAEFVSLESALTTGGADFGVTVVNLVK